MYTVLNHLSALCTDTIILYIKAHTLQTLKIVGEKVRCLSCELAMGCIGGSADINIC